MIENPVKLKTAKEKLSTPQCPACGHYNVRIMRKRRVDFYGIPVVFHCDSCGWEEEITMKTLQKGNKDIENPFVYSEQDLYKLILKQGNKRFGSVCNHEKTRNGTCINCLRKVITK